MTAMNHRPTLRAMLTAGALAAATTVGTAVSTGVAHAAVADPASIVNPFIETAANGDTFPGADAPFGMVQWSPDTPSRPDGGGYSYNDTSITGFSLTHISGPGCSGAGDVPILPEVGAVNTANSSTVTFSHSNESANAGYYSVLLGNGVKTELTATSRSGMGRFTFPATTQADLVFKLGGSANGTSATTWNVVSGTEVSGSVTSGHFCGAGATYTVYFDMVFDQTMTGSGSDYVVFNTTSNTVVQAKVGMSFVSIANAVANRQAENPNWDFASTQSSAHSAWNAMLGKIQISGGTSNQQVSFYTALYHSLLHPNVFSDTNGQYRGVDGNVHTVDAGHSAFYTTFSGWDIYRDQAELEGLVAPQQASDTAQSMIDDYAQGGMLPKWDLNNGETYVMVGDPADSIISGYYAFGGRNFDTATALKDMIAEATTTNNIRPGSGYLQQVGYLPSDGSYGCCNEYGATSTTLEYDSADAAIGWFAGQIGDSANSSKYLDKARDWRNLFNYQSGYVQPRQASGAWQGSYNPGTDNTGQFVEGTGYQYTAMVPFDLRGLADAMGGNAKMNSFLDTITSSLTGANGYADLTNEPSLDIPWEYDYTGEPYKTQALVRNVQDTQWANAPARLSTSSACNDDLGAMSSWYVWSAMGMYPQTPGTSDLALGSPLFTQVVVTLPSGSTLTINGNGAADNAPYVQSATWNGSAWNNAYLPSGAISAGGTFTYTLGTSANTSWASAASSAPPSYQGTEGFANIGISNDSASSSANFDAVSYSYSAQALAAAGVTPGSTISANGLSFTWPNVAAGTPDNYEANGQVVPVSGSGSISFLGSATNGPSIGAATVTYTDGTTQNVQVAFSDWTLGGGGASALASNTIAVTTTYRNHAGAATNNINTYVFATKPVPLASGKTVASVRLPIDVSAGGLHVFAIAVGSTATAATGPITASVGSGLCVDDNQSSTTDGSKIQIWTCNGTTAQQWTVNGDGTLTVMGKCMDVNQSGTANGTLVQLWTCNGTGAQQWRAGPNGSLVNPQSGRCLDDPGSSTTTGTQLQIYDCNGTNAQRWWLP